MMHLSIRCGRLLLNIRDLTVLDRLRYNALHMAKLLLFCMISLSLCLGANGGEVGFPSSVKLKDGTSYEGVKLMSQTPAEVVLRHSNGVANIKISDLSDELQVLLNYSEEEAKALEAAQAEATALRLKQVEHDKQVREAAKILAEKKMNMFMVRGYVHRVLEEGIVVQAGVATNSVYNRIRVSEGEVSKRQYKAYRVPRPIREFGFVYIEGHPRFESLTDRDVIDVDVYRDGIFRSGGETMKRFVYLQEF
ncbi:Unannotated [Lentimonas sp. CC19]|nr:Unannotated [Lentimonas sp. CC19]CAA6694602.1 Unannotated [Lentimonas sp. CC10]CAA7072128.1 Unannotated [Lentimonas sp. CC11]